MRRSLAASDGFTLIEVVVTMAVIAVLLTSIGSLIGVTVRASHAIDDRLALVGTTRAIVAGLPDRKDLGAGLLTGESAGLRWRVDLQPYPGEADARSRSPWVPLTTTVAVQTPDGTALRIATVRLGRKPK
jgi:general secretion pathway protein I